MRKGRVTTRSAIRRRSMAIDIVEGLLNNLDNDAVGLWLPDVWICDYGATPTIEALHAAVCPKAEQEDVPPKFALSTTDWKYVMSILYQILGAYDAPTEVLDLVIEAASGQVKPDFTERIGELLPFTADTVDADVWAELHTLRATVCRQSDGKLWQEVATELLIENRELKAPSLQERGGVWTQECFGDKIANDPVLRNHRFMEEAVELVQSLGCTKEEVYNIVDYVYSRNKGEPAQEVGGVMITLASLCAAHGLDMHEQGEIEMERISDPDIKLKISQKSANKPVFGKTWTPVDNCKTWRNIAIRSDERLNHLIDAIFKIMLSEYGEVHPESAVAKAVFDLPYLKDDEIENIIKQKLIAENDRAQS